VRWATYRSAGEVRTGVLVEEELFAVEPGRDLLSLLPGGEQGLAEAARTARQRSLRVDHLGEVQLMAPVPRPPAVRDGLCFLDHMRNCLGAMGRGPELPARWHEIPAFYFTNPAAVIGPYDDVPVSPGSVCFDLEAEVGVVIGPDGGDLPPERALEHVAGYTLFCDWSARDLQALEGVLGIGQAKGKDGATTLGPFLVTPEEVDPAAIDLRASVNGRELTTGSTAQMDWSFAELIAYTSRGTRLRPGDVIGSGTVPRGCLLEHVDTPTLEEFPGWLSPGDLVEVHSPQLGSLRQSVVAGAPVHRLSSGF
jgi:2-keto-4-pentenoate hydratase/2-oxohepta-3-ene-1,7-dioic acid hydratase in catechol pathway